MSRDKVIKRVRKLLALAEGKANEHESANALAQAQRLMDEYKLTQALVEAESDEDAPRTIEEELRSWEDPIDVMGGKKTVRWKGTLAFVLARANGCHVWWGYQGGKRTLNVIGGASDAAAVRYLYQYTIREIDRLSKQYKGNGRTWLNNFKLGCVDAIKRKLREARDAMVTDYAKSRGVALVKVADAMAQVDRRADDAKAFGKRQLGLRPMSTSYSRYDRTAREQGREDGKRINLGAGKGLGAGRRRALGKG